MAKLGGICDVHKAKTRKEKEDHGAQQGIGKVIRIILRKRITHQNGATVMTTFALMRGKVRVFLRLQQNLYTIKEILSKLE